MKHTRRNTSWIALGLCAIACLAALSDGSLAGSVMRSLGIRSIQEAETVRVFVGRSQHFPSPWAVAGASLTDPDVADVQVLSPDLIQVSGTAPGITDLLMWNTAGETYKVRVEVQVDLSRLKDELARMFPGSRMELFQAGRATIVSGRLQHADQADTLHAYLEALEVDWVDMTSVDGVQQVQVQVRMAEVSRTGIRSLGVNGFMTSDDFFGGSMIGSSSGSAINPVSIGPAAGTAAASNIPFTFNQPVDVSPGVTLFAGFPKSDLEVFIQALAENQLLRLLAEPTLVALSGREASFLAGGEFPIPVVQGAAGGGGAASVTIEYKEFGVGLKFQPTVLGDGTIRMRIASEVSELSDIGSVMIQGFQVPSLVTRRAETTLEMKSGQTFAMAGLMSETTSAHTSRLPGIGELPVLGALFSSVRYKRGETELVVLVTPTLVEPLDDLGLPPLPGTTHMVPTDWELYAEGRIEGRPPSRLPVDDCVWLRDLGLDRLKGPGAWATHEQSPAPDRGWSDQDLERLREAEARAAEPSSEIAGV